jgi:rhamnogalacturonan endolyase
MTPRRVRPATPGGWRRKESLALSWRRKFSIGLVSATLIGAGLFATQSWASDNPDISFDTGAGLTFTVNGETGDMKSLKHNGVELFSPLAKAGGQFESGTNADSVTSQTFADGRRIVVTATDSTRSLTQYYFARKGDNTVYMATKMTRTLGEARYIARLNSSVLPTSATAATTSGSTSTVEGSDVFRFDDGRTASKFYSSQRAIAQKAYGASGTGTAVYMLAGTNEMASGGPFFRDIEVNNVGPTTNVTHYLFSGHEQTEPMRLGLSNPYALTVTDGATPTAHSWSFLSAYIPGLLSDAQRGALAGAASGSWRGNQGGTVALAGPNGQYWAKVRAGKYLIGHVRPGTYTATLYAGELAVGNTKTVTVTAGNTTQTDMSGDAPTPGTLFQLGTFDGTPKGFLNADKIETMHPSDKRMSTWDVGTVDVSAGASTFPMAEFADVNSPLAVRFPLSSVPADGVTLRIAVAESFAGGRPQVSVGSWTSNARLSPAPVKIDSRGVTRGTWRGPNASYTFTIPANVLKAGTNTISIGVLSGSSGTGFLSPNFVFDALALDPA